MLKEFKWIEIEIEKCFLLSEKKMCFLLIFNLYSEHYFSKHKINQMRNKLLKKAINIYLNFFQRRL